MPSSPCFQAWNLPHGTNVEKDHVSSCGLEEMGGPEVSGPQLMIFHPSCPGCVFELDEALAP